MDSYPRQGQSRRELRGTRATAKCWDAIQKQHLNHLAINSRWLSRILLCVSTVFCRASYEAFALQHVAAALALFWASPRIRIDSATLGHDHAQLFSFANFYNII